jgi:hypothetical protein
MALALNKNVRITKRNSAKSAPKEKPRKMLCGLGSWHEQQRSDLSKEINPNRSLHDKTTQYPAGCQFSFDFRLDATQDGLDYTHIFVICKPR